MTTYYSPANIRAIALGVAVTRTAALPPASGASQDLFTIDGGHALLVAFWGRVTVAIPNDSIDFDIDWDPDSGGADVPLATLLAVDNQAAGTFYSLNTTAGGALVGSSDISRNARLAAPILLPPGDIRLDVAGGGAIGTTARVEWSLAYIPWDAAVTVAAS